MSSCIERNLTLGVVDSIERMSNGLSPISRRKQRQIRASAICGWMLVIGLCLLALMGGR